MPEKLGEPEADQAHLDLDKIATGLKQRLEDFDEAVGDVRKKRKLRDAALVAKQAAEKRLNAVMANVARVQEGYFRLAGLEELADRIRLTIPRSRKKKSTEEPAVDPSAVDLVASVDSKEETTA